MSQKSKWEYLKAVYSRYHKVSKALRRLILNEFCQVCGYNRKYAIRLLNGPAPQQLKPHQRNEMRVLPSALVVPPWFTMLYPYLQSFCRFFF